MGKLMNDAVLYENLQQASENRAVLLADLKETPKRSVHFSLFGRSEAKEKERAAKLEEKLRQDSIRRSR